MIIGITGSFGSGKTTVAKMFSKYGFKIINVDRLYHNIYSKDNLLKNKIKKEFGTIDRNKLKKIVFKDSKKLIKLNNITHPIIIKEIRSIIKKFNKINKKIIIDIPLLFEAKLQKMFDKIIVVKCKEKEQIKRTLKKKKYSKKEIEQIVKSQMPLKKKVEKADFVIDNSNVVEDTQTQIKNMIQLNKF